MDPVFQKPIDEDWKKYRGYLPGSLNEVTTDALHAAFSAGAAAAFHVIRLAGEDWMKHALETYPLPKRTGVPQ